MTYRQKKDSRLIEIRRSLARPKYIVAACLVLLMLVAGWWSFLRPPSADEVARMTANALSKGDVDTLLRLTLPEEREKLNLTPQGVRGLLDQTLYIHGLPGTLTAKRVQDYPVDQWLYDLTPKDGDTKGLHFPLPIMVTQRPDGHWYLPLGYLLLTSCSLSPKNQELGDARAHFKRLAVQNQIRGIRLNTTDYQYINNSPALPSNSP